MNEKWRRCPDIAQISVFINRAPPCIPRRCWDRMRWRSDCHEIHAHQFGVGVPTRLEKSRFGLESVVECFATIHHPLPVNAFVELGCELLDLAGIEVGPGVQDPKE